ncbi:MAG: hypothetical protein WC379_11455 [Methanoregula sp.]|jgi:hypothetical protein
MNEAEGFERSHLLNLIRDETEEEYGGFFDVPDSLRNETVWDPLGSSNPGWRKGGDHNS